MATASIRARALRSRFQNGSRVSAPLPSPMKTTAPVLQIQHHGQVAVPVADADLVDSHEPEIPQPGLAEASPELLLHQVLDHVPAHVQVLCHVPHRHVTGQLHHIACESHRVVVLARSEGHCGLPHSPALPALQPRHRQHDPDRAHPNREPSKPAYPSAPADHSSAPAGRAPNPFDGLFDCEVDRAADVLRARVDVAAHPKCVVD